MLQPSNHCYSPEAAVAIVPASMKTIWRSYSSTMGTSFRVSMGSGSSGIRGFQWCWVSLRTIPECYTT